MDIDDFKGCRPEFLPEDFFDGVKWTPDLGPRIAEVKV
jgi:hypothetical protein